MLTATKRFTFDAAHCLERHEGKCSRYHGHTYILEVTVGTTEHALDLFKDQGFFVDFGDMKRCVKGVLDKFYDHHDLNKTVDIYPTAERLILCLWRTLGNVLPHTCKLIHLKLHETPDSWVEYDGHDNWFDHITVK